MVCAGAGLLALPGLAQPLGIAPAVAALVRGVARHSRLVQILQRKFFRPQSALPGQQKDSLAMHVYTQLQQLASEDPRVRLALILRLSEEDERSFVTTVALPMRGACEPEERRN